MNEIHDSLSELWKLVMTAGLDPLEIEVDQYSYWRLVNERSPDGSISVGGGGPRWRHIPLKMVSTRRQTEVLDLTDEVPAPTQTEVHVPPRVITITAKNSVGRITYFNDAQNPEEYR